MSVPAEQMQQEPGFTPTETNKGTIKSAQERIFERLNKQDDAPPQTPEGKGEVHPEAEVQPPEKALNTEVEQEPQVDSKATTEDTDEGEPVTRFSDLSDHLNVDEDYLLSLTMEAKVNGEARSPTIKDLLTNYQKGESADHKLSKVAEQQKQFEAEKAKYEEQAKQDRERLSAMYHELESLMTQDDRDLEVLRHSDPGEYAARVQEKQLRMQRAEQVRQQLSQESVQRTREQYQQMVALERQRLLTAIPEWQDEKTFQTEALGVRKYLMDQGFQDFEIDGKSNQFGGIEHPGMVDHRAYLIARKAMLYDQAKSGTAPKKEKLKTLPKVGTGKQVSKSDAKQTQAAEARMQLKKSGNVKDAAKILQQIMNS